MTSLTITTPWCELTIRKNGWIFPGVSFDPKTQDPSAAFYACEWAIDHKWVDLLLGHFVPEPEVLELIAEVAKIEV